MRQNNCRALKWFRYVREGGELGFRAWWIENYGEYKDDDARRRPWL